MNTRHCRHVIIVTASLCTGVHFVLFSTFPFVFLFASLPQASVAFCMWCVLNGLLLWCSWGAFRVLWGCFGGALGVLWGCFWGAFGVLLVCFVGALGARA